MCNKTCKVHCWKNIFLYFSVNTWLHQNIPLWVPLLFSISVWDCPLQASTHALDYCNAAQGQLDSVSTAVWVTVMQKVSVAEDIYFFFWNVVVNRNMHFPGECTCIQRSGVKIILQTCFRSSLRGHGKSAPKKPQFCSKMTDWSLNYLWAFGITENSCVAHLGCLLFLNISLTPEVSQMW